MLFPKRPRSRRQASPKRDRLSRRRLQRDTAFIPGPIGCGPNVEVLEGRQMLSSVVSTGVGKESPTYVINPNVAPQASPGNQGFTPQQVQAAYTVNNIFFNGTQGTGAGITVAIVDAYNDPDIISDADQFSTEFGLPTFNGTNEPTLKVFNEDGGTALPPNAGATGWDVEESLDVEWVHSMAPQANIILFEATTPNTNDMFTAEQTAAETYGVSVVSNSWGGGEGEGEQDYDSIFTTPAGHEGVTFLVASGDHGSPANYPATSPNVVSVGGTNLQIQSSGTYVSESVWNDGYIEGTLWATSGGPSALESIPSYQAGIDGANGASTTFRDDNDVAADADADSGVWVYDSYSTPAGQPWQVVGGTSLACPLWAGMIAIVNQGRTLKNEGTLDGVSQTLPMLYSLPSSDFHDVTAGNNNTYSAGSGYDLPTGLGTPIADLLVPALAGYTPTQPPSITSPATASTSQNTALVFSSAAGDQISLTDTAAGSNPDTLELSVSDGTLTLASTSGLTFTSGSNDSSSFTVSGTVAELNTALNGLTYQPTGGYAGTDSLAVTVTDTVYEENTSKDVALTITAPPIGTWTTLTNAVPSSGGALTAILLPTGQVLVEAATQAWYLLTPNSSGSYVNGTWTTAGATVTGVSDFDSDVLQNGDVFIVYGGESAVTGDPGQSSAEIYNIATNTWSVVASDPVPETTPVFITPSEVLPDGDVLVADPESNGTEIYNPAANTWSTGGARIYASPGSQWVKLPDGDILECDPYSSTDKFEAEVYNPTTNQWTDASATTGGSLPPLVTTPAEGPAVLLPDGDALYTGANGATVLFNSSTQTWSAGPMLPSVMINGVSTQLAQTQGPEAVLPDGDVVMELQPAFDSSNPGSEEYIFDFNPITGAATNITPSAPINSNGNLWWTNTMLVLPTGQLLLNDSFNANDPPMAVYTPNGTPASAWQPTIASFTQNTNGSYTLTGTQLTGLDDGAVYDNGEFGMAEDYPLVQVTDAKTGAVYYATTTDWSTSGVATGSTPETVNVALPSALGSDPYTIEVIANGISSAPYASTSIPPAVTAPSAAGTAEGIALVFSATNNNQISVSDVNATSSSDTLELSVSNGTLTLATTTGLTIIGGANGSNSFTVAGPVADMEAALNGLSYQPTANYLGTDRLSILLTDTVSQKTASTSVALTTVLPASGTWTVTSNSTIDSAALDDTMLLPTGQLLTHSRTNLSTWYLYTPDSSGGYVNGTATTAGAMSIGVEDFASDVLPNGEVFVVYGTNLEGIGTNTAEMYNPATNSWTVVASDPVPATNGPGNEPSELLDNGDILVGDPTGDGTELYDPSTNKWSTGGATIYDNPTLNEGWVKLPNGDILEYDATSSFLAGKFEAELYNPTTNSWSDASTSSNGSTLPLLTAGASMGPAVLLPDGRALFTGVNGVTLFFNTSTDSWTQGPTLPSVMINGVLTQLTETQGPEAVLPDGDVVMELTAPPPSTAEFVYDFNPTAGVWTNITPPSTIVASFNLTEFNTMLILPTGQLLLNATSGAQQFAIYTPNAGPQAAWQPTITSFVQDSGSSYTLTGTQLNGLDEGAAFSDGFYQMSENYPLVQVTDTLTGVVSYATTSDWSLTGVATGSTPETVNVVMPAALGSDPYSLVVIANGISSASYSSMSVTAPASAEAVENNPLVFSGANNNQISVSDAEAKSNPDTLAFSVSDGKLTLATTAGLTFTIGSNGTSSFTVSGTVAALNAALLSGLTYQPTTNYVGTDTLSLTLTDTGNQAIASAHVSLSVVAPPSQQWTVMTNQVPDEDAGQLALLLPNGQLFVHGLGNGDSASWYLVTPDKNGNYADGTWTVAGSMNVGRLYFGSVVLPNGEVFVVGGEYATDESFTSSAEIYNPVTNTWTMVASDPQPYTGDEEAELLPDGNVLVGNILNNGTEIYDPATNVWTAGPNKVYNDQSDEESWVKLANGDILNYDLWSSIASNTFEAELYNPTTNTWTSASNTVGTIPLLSTDATGDELGPALLLANGDALFTGTNGTTAIYNPNTNLWTQGPTMPSVMIDGVKTQLTTGDAPGAILPNGDVVLALSPPVYIDSSGEEEFPAPTYIYDWNPSANVWTNISPSSSIDPYLSQANSYINTMLILPTGQLLLADDYSPLAIYTPDGSPQAAWEPTITSFVKNSNGSYTLTGTQLNGLDEGAAYGDDNQMAENYPIVRVTDDQTGIVYYATTSDWSSFGVATGSTPETVNVVLPSGLGNDAFTIVVIADGISSAGFSTTVYAPTITAPQSVTVAENSFVVFSSSADEITVSDTGGTAEQMTLSVKEGSLYITNNTGISVSGDNTSTLTLTGPLSSLDTDLVSLGYTPNANYAGADTLSISDADTADLLVGTASVSITVTALAPSITAPPALSVDENSTLDLSGGNAIKVVDVGGTAEQLTLSVKNGVLALGTMTGLSVTGNDSSSMTLTGSLTALNSDLPSLTYTPTTGYTGSDTLSISDADTADNLTGTGSISITVLPLSPFITAPKSESLVENGSLTFSGGGAITLSDGGGSSEQLTLSVSDGTLSIGTSTGLSVTGNNSASLTLTGAIGTLNSDLATVTYTPGSGFVGTDTLSLFVEDQSTSLTGSASMSLVVAALAPTLTVPGSQTVGEGQSLAFSPASGNAISINDINAGGDSLALSVSHGALTLPELTGLSITGTNGTASFTVSGSLTAINNAIDGLIYVPATNYTGPDTIELIATNLTYNVTNSGSVALNVEALPTVTAPASAVTPENTALVFLPANGYLLSVTDQGAGNNDDTLTLSASNGTLTPQSTSGLTLNSGAYGSNSFTVTGQVSSLDAVVTGLIYQPDYTYIGPDLLSLTLNDPSDNLSAVNDVAITVEAITAPSISGPATATVNENSSLLFSSSNNNQLTLSDDGTGGNADTVTLQVSHGTLTLGETTGVNFIGGANGSSSVTVKATVANLNAALNDLTYQPTNGYAGSDTLSIMVSDPTDNDKGAGSVSLTVLALAPTITAPTSESMNENGSLPFAPANGNGITLNDANPGTDSLTITVGHGTLTLATLSGLTVTAGANGTKMVTVTGTVANLNAALNGVIYQPTTGYTGVDSFSIALLDTGNNQTAAATVNLSIVGAAPPTITAPATGLVAAGSSLVFTSGSGNAISVGDTGIGAGSDSLSLSVTHGTLKLASTTGLTFTSGANNSSSFTVSGNLANLNADLIGLTYVPTSGYTGSDSLKISISDPGDGQSASTSVALTIEAYLAPTISVPSSASVSENDQTVFSTASNNAITVADTGPGSSSDSLMLSVSHGILTLASTTGLTVTAGANGTASMTVTGSVANLNAALNGLVYAPTTGYVGSDKLAVSIKDASDSLSASASVNISVAVLTAPAIKAPTAVTAKGTFTFTGSIAISISDPYATSTSVEQLLIRVSGGTLSLGSTTGLTFVSGSNNSLDMVVEGTLASFNAALATLSYSLSGSSQTIVLVYTNLQNAMQATASIVVSSGITKLSIGGGATSGPSVSTSSSSPSTTSSSSSSSTTSGAAAAPAVSTTTPTTSSASGSGSSGSTTSSVATTGTSSTAPATSTTADDSATSDTVLYQGLLAAVEVLVG